MNRHFRARTRMLLAAWLLAGVLDAMAASQLKLIVPRGFTPDLPVLVRVELRRIDGNVDRDLWDAEAILSVDQPGVTLSTNRVSLRNGLGSALVTFAGATNFNLTATCGGLQAARPLTDESASPVTTVSGTLSVANTTWSGVIRVTGDLTIPAGRTLTIQPGTQVLLNGVASGTAGTDIIVEGSIQSLGTESRPVTITCRDPGLRWGQIRHNNAQPSLYRYTAITLGGRAPGEGHTGTGPVIRPSNSPIAFEHCSITDHADASGTPGKIMLATDSELTFTGCLLARSRMGPEIDGTSLVCSNTWIMEMRGPDDADGIYIHAQQPGQIALLTGCVLAGGDDDGVDTLGANVTVENCVIRDWLNPNEDTKGISVFNGETTVRRSVFANCYVGIAAKSDGPLATVNISHCTVTGITRGVSAAFKSNASAGNIAFRITNSIIRSVDAVHTDFGPTNFSISYCNLAEAWPGAGNLTADPLFVSALTNFHVRANSPCVDAGDPALPLDPDGTRPDVGAHFSGQGEVVLQREGVVINEIMYHPSSEDVREEFIELFNRGTNTVNVSGWRFNKGVQFTIPTNTVISANGFLVVAANLTVFTNKYPDVTNVVGNWTGILSNSREDIDLDDATGERMDSVTYADEGDWAVRQRGPLDWNHRGWTWFKPHDGGGGSLELMNPRLSNNFGRNWGASVEVGGTPGRLNSMFADNVPPVIFEAAHSPIAPKSTDTVLVTMRVLDERPTNVTAELHFRVDAVTPAAFSVLPMFDDGAHDDGAAHDGIFGAVIPPQTNNAVVEFFVRAVDLEGFERTWPEPAIDTDGTPLGRAANLLYQVDDSAYTESHPLYKFIMREADRAELAAIGNAGNGEQNSDAQMNATFVSIDGAGASFRYQAGIRNRGHGSRSRQPNNFRVNLPSDAPWKGVTAININGQFSHVQLLGSVLVQKSGLAAANSRPVQLRVNNLDLANDGPQTYGRVYAANEVLDADWAENHFPLDASGNVYRAIRDIPPPDFVYRGDDRAAYTNTWFKETNVSEDDWTDLIGMLRIVGTNDLFTTESVRQVIDVEQWLTHLAFMAICVNLESGLNTGNNDDYLMYRGVNDPRFILLPYDLDTIFGEGGVFGATNTTIFGAATAPTFNQLMQWPDFAPIYYRTVQRLLDTTFSAAQFDATVDQTIGRHVPPVAVNRIKTWMSGRRAYVQSVIAPLVTPEPKLPVALISGEPRSPTPFATVTLTVGGEGVTHYRFALNGGAFGPETPVNVSIALAGLANGSTNIVRVIGRNLAGAWQATNAGTLSSAWVINASMPAIRINEVLANNAAAANHNGTFPDMIELFNEGAATVDLSGLRLTDDLIEPDKFTFSFGTSLDAGAHLVLYANNNDGTPGIHLGFALNQDGEGVFLFDRKDRGGALLDSVEFGLQLPDLPISRLNGGRFVLSPPTMGSPNTAQPLGNERQLRINEWLADELSLSPTDFLELHNPEPLPISLGGLLLTDNPIGWPARHRIAPLSFIAAGGYRAFKADGDPEQGADHLNFGLAVEQGMVALLTPDQSVIDCVAYGPQRRDVSEGRSPNGTGAITFFQLPTPGAPNPSFAPEIVTTTNVLIALTNVWRFNQTSNLTGVNWPATNFNDASWLSGQALLYFDDDSLPGPKNTELALGRTTYYFRARFDLPGPAAGVSLRLAPMVDDGAVFYLNGQEVYRIGMPAGTITYATQATNNVNNASLAGPFPISASALVQGTNVFAAEVHQFNPSSQDIVLAAILEAIVTTTNAPLMPVVLNEVLADNQSLTNASGATADWLELFNPTDAAVDISETSLSDEFDNPRKWVVPPGTSIPPVGFVVVYCDSSAPASTNNTGFGLSVNGGAVYFFHRPAVGGALVDAVTYGVQAADYSIGRIGGETGAWNLAVPSPGATNIAATLGNTLSLRINEWMANPGEGDDWIELFNPNPQPVALSGLALTDDLADRDKSPIPALSFIGVGDAGFRRFVADGSPGSGADHLDFNLSTEGESIGLFTSIGGQIDALNFGAQVSNVSEGRFPDGAANVVAFPQSPSPDESNFLPLSDVVINELLSHTDPPLEDAIEFYNPTATDIDIGGWFLSNAGRDLRRFRIPEGTAVPARGFRVLYEYQFGTNTGTGALVPFTFDSAHGDQAHLSATNGSGGLSGYRARVEFGAATNGVSFGRYTNSVGQVHFVAMSSRSFGVDAPVTVQQFRAGQGALNPAPLVGPIVVSEIMHAAGTNDGGVGEFVELQNVTGGLVPLFDPDAATNTWRIRQGIDFDFPPFTTLAPGERLLVVAFHPVLDPLALAAFRARYNVATNVQIVGPFDGQLSDAGEAIELLKPDPPQRPPQPDAGFVPFVMVERIEYSGAAPWPTNGPPGETSLQRQAVAQYGNDPANWFVAAPTAGRSNQGSSTDRDGDGLPNDWETEHLLDPDNAVGDHGADGDPDGDGMSNAREYASGTDPGDNASVLKIDNVRTTPGDAVLRFTAVAGRTYSAVYSDATPTGPWLKLADVPAQVATGAVEVHDPGFGGVSSRYYRLVTPQLP